MRGKCAITSIKNGAQTWSASQEINGVGPPDPAHHMAISISALQLHAVYEQKAQIVE
jgi:hypothetical protein